MRVLVSGERTDPTELDDRELVRLYDYPEGRRWVRANFVATVDGAAQGPDHRSGSLSGAADRHLFALLRALADVVLVGAGTVRAEGYGPATIRSEFAGLRRERGLPATPPIAVVTHTLDVPEKLLADPRTVVLAPGSATSEQLAALAGRVDVAVVGEELVDLRRALDALAERGHRRILCEGGPLLFSELASAGLVDELCLTVAPRLSTADALRITQGTMPGHTDLRLDTLLEADGFLFFRWLAA